MISARDFRVAFSTLGRSKGYVATIVITLGITLGALIAMYNLNRQLFSAPLPYPDQERLFVMQTDVYHDGRNISENTLNMTPYAAVVEAYKHDVENFEKKALVNFYVDTIRSLPTTPQVNSTYITPEYLQLLQPEMALGRVFNPDEGLESRTPVVVIAYSTWQQLFKADPEILSRTLRFGDVDFRVIGVLAESFVEPQLIEIGRITEVWLPWDFNRVPQGYRGWGGFIEHEFLVGKIKTERSKDQVELSLTSLINTRYKQETASVSSSNNTLAIRIESFSRLILGDSGTRAYMLLAGALVLFLIAAANITNLILARAANRQRIMAIQAALGALKSHLFDSFFAEILVLMLLAAVLSLLIAFGGLHLLRHVADGLLPRVSELTLAWQSLVIAFSCALLLAMFFSFLVSRQVDYRALNGMLQSSGKGVGIQISKKVRQVLILSQVALTGVLLAASLQILQRSLHSLSQPIGLATENIYQVILNMGSQSNAPSAERASNLVAIRNELLGSSKVLNVTLASFSPLGETSPSVENFLAGHENFDDAKGATITYADEKYLDVMGLELIAGRNFTQGEFQNAARAVIINESLAHALQADGQVINKRFYSGMGQAGNNSFEVVGVLRDLTLPGKPELSRMFIAGVSDDFPRLIIKMKPRQVFSKIEVNELMAKVNGEFKASLLLSMPQAHSMLLAEYTVAALLTAALSVLTLGLAAIGIFGVLSYSVQLRQFELGIRMALGARPLTVFLQIISDNLAPVILGLVVALTSLVALYLWLQQSIYSVAVSPVAWITAFVLIIALASMASLSSVWHIIRKPAVHSLRDN